MIRFFILVSVVIFSACKPQKTDTIIRGNIIGDISKSMFYTVPVNGGCTWQFMEEIVPDSSGHFQIELQLEEPAFMRLVIPNKLYDKFIIAEPAQDYDLTLDFSTDENIFNVKCESELGHKFYNSLDQPTHIDVMADKLSTDSSFSYINEQITLTKEKEFILLERQRDQGNMSEEFYTLVKIDRQTYYESLTAAVALRKHSYYRRDNEVAKADEILKDYNQLYKDYDISDVPLYSQWSFNLLHHFVTFKRLNLIHPSSPKTPNINIEKSQNNRLSRWAEITKQNLSGDHLEYYLANYLSVTISRKKSKEYALIKLAEDFKADYQESTYISHLDSIIQPVIEFHQKANQSLNENIVIVDDYLSINSLEECAQIFEGKKIYVDVWATWCQPCLKEFEHSEALVKLLEKKDIALLYISIDKQEKDEEWKERISFQKLEGHHIRTNEVFYNQLLDIQQGVPLYLIIDEQGNILKRNAGKPSQIEALEKELDEI